MIEKTIILAELDVLLDTRMGTLATIDEKLISLAIKNGYHNRLTDTWSYLNLNVDQDDYKKRYDDRGLEVLSMSKPTAILEAVNLMLNKLAQRAINTPLNGIPELHVNTYPYLFEEHVKEQIINAVMYYLPMDIEVKTTYISPDDLTPDVIRKEFSGIIMYDFDTWLKLNQKRIGKTKLHDITFIVPALHYNGVIPTSSELQEVAKELNLDKATSNTTFAAVEASLIEFIHLIMVDVKNFSFILPEK